jgi:hypothetical protein
MPLTISHPVAVLPLKRLGLPLSAMVAGSLSPDFEFLLWLRPHRAFFHTPAGLILACLPVSLAMLWVYHGLWAPAAKAWLGLDPPGERPQELFRLKAGLRTWILIGVAVLVGAFTHVAWDAFTHQSGWVVRHVSALSLSIGPVHVYKALQHGSSLLGLAILGGMALRRREALAAIPRERLIAAAAFLLIISALAIASAAGHHNLTLQRFVGIVVIRFFAIGMLAVTLASAYQLRIAHK